MGDGDRPARAARRSRAARAEAPVALGLPVPDAAVPAPEPARRLPVLPLRGLAVFPGARVPLQIGRQTSLRAVAAAVASDHRLLFCAQRDPECDEPGPADLHEVGTLAMLREVRSGDGEIVRILAEGLARVRLHAVLPEPPDGTGCLFATAELLHDDEPDPGDPELAARAAAVLRRFERLRAAAGRDRVGGDGALPGIEEPGRLCDAIAARALQRPEDRQAVLEAVSVRERLSRLHRLLLRQVEESEVERDVQTRARRQMERAQREYYLREQLKAIQRELGEGGGEAGGEADDLRARIAAAAPPPPVAERVERELQRLERMPAGAAEAVVLRNYLEWIAALPWSARAEEHLDLEAAQRVLDEEHRGLDPVKERILEHLALRRLQTARSGGAPVHGPVLCLVGPPGGGKTSLARAVARALGRPFVRISLGGVRDEADIRGHRRTYVGALPGRIITAMRQAGSRNPVLLLDELDKLAADYRGDPAAALLEVLDPEQNAAFTDHYLEVPFDLSDVLFICTANHLGPLPRPLLDRLEVLQLPGYGDGEKLAIARAHLLPRQIAEAALPEGALRVTDGAIRVLIDRYTREAGVRGLERALGAICRKVARRVVAGQGGRVTVTARNVGTFLGRPRIHRQGALPADAVGVAMGLAWTETGGDVLPVEVSVLPGRGSLQLTGKLGEVMRESAQAALTFVRANASAFGLDPDFYGRCELHVHVPEGAVPKDGPSAGVTLAAALLSALSGVPVRADTALTGEITLRGRLLPVGGIKEKVLAARRAGLRRVVLPAENRPDWEEVGAAVSGLSPLFVEAAEEALAAVLVGGLPGPADDCVPAPPPGFLAAAPAPRPEAVTGGAACGGGEGL
jgi:ATP-dependent Lon protease